MNILYKIYPPTVFFTLIVIYTCLFDIQSLKINAYKT